MCVEKEPGWNEEECAGEGEEGASGDNAEEGFAHGWGIDGCAGAGGGGGESSGETKGAIETETEAAVGPFDLEGADDVEGELEAGEPASGEVAEFMPGDDEEENDGQERDVPEGEVKLEIGGIHPFAEEQAGSGSSQCEGEENSRPGEYRPSASCGAHSYFSRNIPLFTM